MPPLASRIHMYRACSIVYVCWRARDCLPASTGSRLPQKPACGKQGRPYNGGRCSSDVALLGCAGMPLGVGKVRAAEPLAAALAILLSAVVAGFIHARDSLAGLFLWLDGWCRHRSSSAVAALEGWSVGRFDDA